MRKLARKDRAAAAKPPSGFSRHWPALVLCGVAAVLLLANLGNQYLWQDEAQTALIARTVLAHGVPLGYDGRNSFSQELGKDYGRNYLWKWHSWLPFYVLAGFFAVFGEGTLQARLPFALFGLATVVLIYYFARSLFGSRRIGVLAAVCLLMTVPFLILCRQCRYYAPEMFFSLLGLHAYHNLLLGRKHSKAMLFAAAMLLFHTHYVHCAALMGTVLLHASAFRKDKLKTLVLISAALLALNLPWIVWFAGMNEVVGGGWALRAFGYAAHLLTLIGKHVVSPVLLLAPIPAIALGWLQRRQLSKPDARTVQNVALLLLFCAITLGAAGATATWAFFRVIAPMVPILALVSALLVESIMKIHPAAGLAVIAAMAFFSQMRDYAYEISHDYDGPVEGICKYLKSHAKPTDVVAITYEDLPVKFYTGLRVVGGLTGEDLSPIKKARYVIVRRNTICEKDAAVIDYIRLHLDFSSYEPVVLDYPDTPYENREEPDEHYFRTVEDADPVVILERTGP